jgi:hypothetical protein
MTTLAAQLTRYPFAAARLDADGRVRQTCPHDHGRSDAGAIACARTHGWDGFAELLVADDAPVRPLDVWRFRDDRGTTHLQSLGFITGAAVVLTRPRS